MIVKTHGVYQLTLDSIVHVAPHILSSINYPRVISSPKSMENKDKCLKLNPCKKLKLDVKRLSLPLNSVSLQNAHASCKNTKPKYAQTIG
jgi:hypothetical protein